MDYQQALQNLNTKNSRLVNAEIEDLHDALSLLMITVKSLADEPTKTLTIPSLFGKAYNENFISDYFAYTLDPLRNGIGNKPLLAILEFLEIDTTNYFFDQVTVIREHTFTNRGRIDFLINVDDTLVIAIENKILSPEGKKQTQSYERSIDDEYVQYDKVFIFLSPEGRKASSDLFFPLSYEDIFNTYTTLDVGECLDHKRAFYWQDFLSHLEEYIIMTNTLPELSERTKLFLEHYDVIRDLESAFERDSQYLIDYLSEKVLSFYEGGEWNLEKTPHYQLLEKESWNNQEYRVFLVFRIQKDILSKGAILVQLEVQGQRKEWNTSPHIESFIKLFKKINPGIQEEMNDKNMKSQSKDRPTNIASKRYSLKGDPISIDNAFDQALNDFSFLIEPVDKTVIKYSE